jgi:hypothetical protein
MGRRHPSRRMTGKHFAQIPVEVLTSEACTTLPNYSVRVLIAVAAQYRGNNNGNLAMTRSIAREFGITSQGHLVQSLAALLERRLIVKTRQGGKKPLRPCLYAVTWQPISDLRDKIESGPTTTASNAWSTWTSGPPADQNKLNHRVCRRSASGLPTERKGSKSALPPDQTEASIGSAGSPPSRIWREGTLADIAPAEALGTINGIHDCIPSVVAHVRRQH